jgi:hypothetical protein
VQSTPRATNESGPLEEDASAIDNAGVGTGAFTKDPALARLNLVLEAVRSQRGCEGGDHPGLVLIAEVRSDGAASETEIFRRFRTNTLATPTPQADPPRRQEVPVEEPDRVNVVDFHHLRVHGTTLRKRS